MATAPKTEEKPVKMDLMFLTKFVKPFNGDREILPAFLTSCQNAVDLCDPDQKSILCKFILSQLQGKAATACSLKEFKNWDDLKRFLRYTFGEKKHLSHLLIELQNSRQLQSETVTQFGLRVESCLTKIQADILTTCADRNQLIGRISAMEDLALNAFILGLHPNISTVLRCRNPSSLNTAISLACDEEKVVSLQRSFQRPPSKFCSTCNKQGHSNSECFRNKSRPPKQISYVPQPQNQPQPSVSSHNPNYPPRNNFNKSCAYCKNKGHTINECRKREYNNRRRTSQPDPRDTGAGHYGADNARLHHYCDDDNVRPEHFCDADNNAGPEHFCDTDAQSDSNALN